MKKRILSLFLALVLLLSLSVSAFAAAPAAASHFTDVPTTHWAYANIERAYSDGVMAGTGGNAAKYFDRGTVCHHSDERIFPDRT